MSLRRVLRAVVLTLGVTASVFALDQQASPAQPALETILARAADYVVRYLDVMANLTAEEKYIQDVVGVRMMTATRSTRDFDRTATPEAAPQHREIGADIVLVKVGPPLEWRVYRDVFEVDRQPVRDRANRLGKLLLEPAERAQEQAERIGEESARFNISNVGRVLNVPGLPVVFLQPTLQPHFAFALDKRDGGNVWIVKYEERARPTLFFHNRTVDNPSSGRFWIDAVTGEITRSEHIVEPPPGIRAVFTTQMRHNDRFGVAIPVEMREQLTAGVQANARKVEGVATYSNYKKFDVSTR